MNKRILIVEGPAGAGKSYLTRALLESTEDSVLIASSLSSRDPKTDDAVIQSMLNDRRKMADALMSPRQAVVIDRLLLSQLVYGRLRSIRCLGTRPDIPYREMVLGSWIRSWFEGVYRELCIRRGQDFEYSDIEAAFVVLMPANTTIESRRAAAQRVTPERRYPWPAELERITYQQVAEGLRDQNLRLMKYDTDRNTAEVVGVCSNWLTRGGSIGAHYAKPVHPSAVA